MDERAAIPPGLPRDYSTRSYWQDPPDNISEHQTTRVLPSYAADYVIIGSGISGTCIAYNLLVRKPNARVLMLEAREACSGATGRNGGHTKAASYRSFPMHVRSHGLEEACKIARLEYSNILETHKLAQEQNIQCESRPCCTVDIIYDEYAFRSGTAAVEMIRKSLDASDGAADYAIYNSEETASKFLTPGAVGSFRYPAGSISAYKFTIGLLKICLSKGLSLYTNTAAHSVEAIHAPPPGGSRYQVLTPERAISTNHIIFATNGYTAHLIPQLQGKIVPLRGQVTAQKPGPRLQERKPGGLETTYSFIYSTGYEYMIPRPSLPLVPPDGIGDIIIGGGLGRLPQEGLGEYGNTDDTVLNSENSAYLKETLKTYFAENWGDDNPMYRVKKEWTGIMGITGDGVPFVGEVPGMKGCWISAGFNGHGMVLCLKCAEALTHMVVGDDESEYTWFPESFRITEKRLNEVIFEGRKGMKAPEVAMAKA